MVPGDFLFQIQLVVHQKIGEDEEENTYAKKSAKYDPQHTNHDMER